MSDTIDPTAEEGADLTAAEYVLGVLAAGERDAAARRIASDAAFAREVDRWTAILAPLASLIEAITPPPALWARIERAISGAGGRTAEVVELGLRRSLRLWRAAAASAGAIAAVLLAALLLGRPTPLHPVQPSPPSKVSPPSPEPLLVARLQAKHGGPSFVASLDRSTRELVITPGTVKAVAGRSPELWLIPEGEKPVALGLASFSRPIRLQAVAAVGAHGRTVLAMSIEPLGGSPTGQPTGPVVATGELTAL